MTQSNNIFYSAVYFLSATLITAWFIAVAPMYISEGQMVLSGSIAGGKWAVQIIAAFIWLPIIKWEFLRRIGHTCFIGSALLLPYCVGAAFSFNSPNFFIGSLVVAVVAMVVLYYQSVRSCRITIRWWWGWLVCLAIAITLQLTVVFEFF